MVVRLESFSELDGSPLELLGASLATPLEPMLAVLIERITAAPITVVTGPSAVDPAVLPRAAGRRSADLLFAGSGPLLATARRLVTEDDPMAVIAGLSRLTFVAVLVDDADLGDPDCRAFVDDLHRRAGADAPIVVFACRGAERPLSLGEPYRRLRLRPLPAAAVTELSRGRVSDDVYPSIGGNAVLVEAALDDVAPAAFGRAVHRVLGGELTPVAQAIAVLGEQAEPFVLSRVLGMTPGRLGELFDELIAIGLLAPDHTLRSRVRTAVLTGAEPAASRRLNLRAAEVLHQDAAPAPVVARHLLAAGVAAEPWASAVLCEAAGQAARERRFDEAAAQLTLALDWSAAPAARAEIRSRLLDVRWWSDPAQAGDLLTALMAAARDGHLAPERTARLARLAAWQGRADDALVARDGDDRWVRHVFPGPGTVVHSAAAAVEMLRHLTPGEANLEDAQIAVFTLLGLERFDPDQPWFGRLARAVAVSELPPWQSLLAGAWAAAALWAGDPGRAAAVARRAIGDDRWSVREAVPRAVLLLALTELGQHAEVAAAVTVPAPADLTRSPYGLLHLRARGRHHLATGAPQRAADDFRTIGDRLTSWGIEAPGLLPWRADLSEALLRLGDRDTARQLAEEHLTRSPAPSSWSRTRAAQLLATTLPDTAPPRLTRAEAKVAGLAARGHTNREISAQLYITMSTVEQHLTRIYRKLGVARRDELGDAVPQARCSAASADSRIRRAASGSGTGRE
ncbi:LuxR C-terminal-related transcriptional regulator [Paractinoplanes durhamensis]|uniref:LuxR C-terminal-related transcriptional regulator n=1 Tax=Paractinoplanes durhamensis TaxID=113563 RepID=UPI003633ED86